MNARTTDPRRMHAGPLVLVACRMRAAEGRARRTRLLLRPGRGRPAELERGFASAACAPGPSARTCGAPPDGSAALNGPSSTLVPTLSPIPWTRSRHGNPEEHGPCPRFQPDTDLQQYTSAAAQGPRRCGTSPAENGPSPAKRVPAWWFHVAPGGRDPREMMVSVRSPRLRLVDANCKPSLPLARASERQVSRPNRATGS